PGWYRVEAPRPWRGASCFSVFHGEHEGFQTMTTTTVLDDLQDRAISALAAVRDLATAAEWEREYLGGRSQLTAFLKTLGTLDPAQRPVAGRRANEIKQHLASAYERRRSELEATELTRRLVEDAVDVTLPGRQPVIGAVHPVTRMIAELSEIFALMGFQAVFGPEVETGRYNFDLLNIPSDHPARDVWDTIIVDTDGPEIVLRTHTSPMQARIMEMSEPPVRVVVPGRCYRYEAQDASHEWMFHQLEGLAVDEQITMADLKGVLAELARQLFGPERRIRFRCDFFPFVEPGVEFAVDCAICGGKGCRVCKHSGWLEMGGAGMVHPHVLRGVGYDPERYTGFAFGLGIERMIMMKEGVDDVRAFAGGDLRFLRQFARVPL
ncbi:MAG TPA: phenylalanine--tRNA ligase subunit alpha, partial [Thermomicrobiales bacterium]|nr:phenylalanine--tRNA ligase subunit alpha [Thermomicrobiales bacterium]